MTRCDGAATFFASTQNLRASFIVGLITSSDEGEAAESSGNNARLHFCALPHSTARYTAATCERTFRTRRVYIGVNKGLHVLLSRTQAGPGRTVKQEQEEISRNHEQTFIYLSVHRAN